jgi:hypothetical protein
MGAAYFPSFDKEVDGYDPSVEVGGKPLSRAIEQLDKICESLGVPTVMPIEWTTPEAGLKTFDTLIAHLEKNPAAVPDAKGVLADLHAFRKVMKVAQKNRARFRLRIDI